MTRILAVILVFVIVGPAVVVAATTARQLHAAGAPLTVAGLQSIRACDSTIVSSLRHGRTACYESAISRVMAADGTADGLRSIARVGSDRQSPFSAACHVLLHPWGESHYQDVELRDIATIPSHCTTGFIHGAIIGRVRDGAEFDPASVDAVCDIGGWTATWSCLHGFGHAFVQESDGDLGSGLQSCARVGSDAEVRTCASGAMMENEFGIDRARGSHPPSHPTSRAIRQLCTGLRDERLATTCWAWVDPRSASIRTIAGTCESVPEANAAACWRRVGSETTVDDVRSMCTDNAICWTEAASTIRSCDAAPPPMLEDCGRGLGLVAAARGSRSRPVTAAEVCAEYPTSVRTGCVEGVGMIDRRAVDFG